MRAITASMIGASLRSLSRALRFALGELGKHFLPEQLEALHDVLVAVLPRLRAEDHLVDADLLVAPQVLADLVGRADRTAQPAEPVLDDLGAEALVVARAIATATGSNPCSDRRAWYSAHTSVPAGAWRPNT